METASFIRRWEYGTQSKALTKLVMSEVFLSSCSSLLLLYKDPGIPLLEMARRAENQIRELRIKRME